MKDKEHIHTYQRIANRPQYYRCIHPNCTSFTSKNLIIGKIGLCPKCQTEFVLDREKLKRVRPLCDNCANTKVAKEKRRIASIAGVAEVLSQIVMDDPEMEKGEETLS